MKAIRVHQFGGPDVLQIETVPDLTPGNGQIVVNLQACGVNPVDTYIRSGKYARLPALPYTPGIDGAGIVTQAGPGVSGWLPGARAYLSGSLTGTYAEQSLCDASQLHRLPENISFAQGAALGVAYVTACLALFHRAAARPGESVLIHGATGGVGLAAVQLARAAGLHVLGTGGTESGRELVREQGAHAVFDHGLGSYAEEILKHTEGRGVDVIIEMLANVNLGRDGALLAPGGRISVVGSRGPVEINPRDLMSRNADVRGVMLFGLPQETANSIHSLLQAGLENGTLRPVIAQEFKLSDARRAHEAVMSSGAHGKIVLVTQAQG